MSPRGVRVVAGRHRGLRLTVPPGEDIRPTADRVKEALFSILAPRLPGAAVIDLFAGSGALGIEALSRGAASAVFVESHPRSLRVLAANLERIDDPRGRVVAADALRPGRWAVGALPADLILADPPYRSGVPAALLEALDGADPLRPGGLLVIEHERGLDASHPGWSLTDSRHYGDTSVSFFIRAPEGLLDSPPSREA